MHSTQKVRHTNTQAPFQPGSLGAPPNQLAQINRIAQPPLEAVGQAPRDKFSPAILPDQINLEHLPTPILSKIFSYLPRHDEVSFILLNKRLQKVGMEAKVNQLRLLALNCMKALTAATTYPTDQNFLHWFRSQYTRLEQVPLDEDGKEADRLYTKALQTAAGLVGLYKLARVFSSVLVEYIQVDMGKRSPPSTKIWAKISGSYHVTRELEKAGIRVNVSKWLAQDYDLRELWAMGALVSIGDFEQAKALAYDCVARGEAKEAYEVFEEILIYLGNSCNFQYLRCAKEFLATLSPAEITPTMEKMIQEDVDHLYGIFRFKHSCYWNTLPSLRTNGFVERLEWLLSWIQESPPAKLNERLSGVLKHLLACGQIGTVWHAFTEVIMKLPNRDEIIAGRLAPLLIKNGHKQKAVVAANRISDPYLRKRALAKIDNNDRIHQILSSWPNQVLPQQRQKHQHQY